MPERMLTRPADPAGPRGTATGSITTAQGAALYIGAVLGTGVIALPALAARIAGPASLLAWAALVVTSVPVAVTFASLARSHPDAGGVSTFVARAFGASAATVTGWWFLLGVAVGIPALGMFGGGYVRAALGGGQGTMFVAATTLLAIGFAAALAGFRVSAGLQLALACGLAALLVAAVIAALPRIQTANLHPFAPHGWIAVGSASTVLVWSFTGWEAVTHLSGEFRRPRRDLWRATWIALGVVGTLYLAIATVSVLALGPRLPTAGAPLAALLSTTAAATVVGAAAAVVLTLGTLGAYLSSAAKLSAALGRDGGLPGWFAIGARPGEVPRRGLALIGAGVTTALAVTYRTGADAAAVTTACTAFLVAVQAIGLAAGVRLLRGRERTVSIVALILMSGVLMLAGRQLAWPAVTAAAALGCLTGRWWAARWRGRRAGT